MPLATLVCLLLAMPLLSSLLRGPWWVPAVVLMVAVTAVSALYRLTSWNLLPVPLLQLLAAAVLITPMFAAGDALAGVVPTADSIAHLARTLQQGLNTIDTNAPPVAASAGVPLIIGVVFVVFMITADFLAVTARCPGMVGGLLLALLAVPLVVEGETLAWGAMAAAAAGFLGLLAADMWVRGREWGMFVPYEGPEARVLGGLRRFAVTAVAVTAAILLALSLPAAVPSLRSDVFNDLADGTYIRTGGEDITTPHPFVSLRRDLGSLSDRTVLTYRSTSDDPDYLRMFALDEFDGVNWTMTPVNASDDNEASGELPLPAGWSEPAPEETVTTQISMDSDSPRVDFLPMPYWASSVEVPGQWYIDPASHMVFTTSSPTTGLNFTVESVEHQPSGDELAAAGNPRSLGGGHLDLPDDLDPAVEQLTEQVTANADTPYERSVAIQEYFTDGSFTYDLSPPSAPEGVDPLAHFLLTDQVGYCEQFAGAMAVMARQADVPSRVAVGYTAGENIEGDRWSVTVGDAHAWPELYFEDVGWVRFEPTPASSDAGQGSATVPEYSSGGRAPGTDPVELPEPGAEEPAPPEPSTPADEPSESPRESESPEDEASAPMADGGDDGTSDTDLSWLPAAGAVAGGLLLLSLPALARVLVRWTRTSGLPGAAPVAGAHTAWRELRDTWLDLGGVWDLAESPRATAERLAGHDARTRAALWRLALAEESARYAPAPADGTGLREDLLTARAGLMSAASRGARLRAVLLPRSLPPWAAPRPAPAPA
ncbi:transglutaminaseTgpA domain-containing protein [Nocardiopsis sp. NRRL B-16309]|uniref:transglutaminaseTgpA domain-containing protein n=1 Tax=Nocardiopsis sp. NRRL B-16309 TaxID=1519494 RepID=UPI0006AF8967|nr:transglutaminaseTgpA domain-containing protein [Nocardiopsis sp. NRRL B-16309]KOX07281.1 transglutaminase [Nocardiopsis sp. NRRL B-16309]